MTQDPVDQTLLRMVVPMIFGLVSVFVNHLVDTFYIGMLGVRELAAISFTFPVTLAVMSLGFGLNTGTSTMVSHSIGQGNPARVRRMTTDSLGLTVVLMGMVAFLGYWSIDPIFQTLGANSKQLPIIHEFMDIWFLGAVFIAIPIVGNGAIRATGDSLTPSLIMLVIAGVNAVLDPLLIFGIGPFPELGVRGAAIATVIAFVCAMLAELWVMGVRGPYVGNPLATVAGSVGLVERHSLHRPARRLCQHPCPDFQCHAHPHGLRIRGRRSGRAWGGHPAGESRDVGNDQLGHHHHTLYRTKPRGQVV